MIGSVSPKKMPGAKPQAPGTFHFVVLYGVPYGLVALIRACDVATALLGNPGGGVQVLLPVACRVMTL